jgi:serine/threonine-protein kinase
MLVAALEMPGGPQLVGRYVLYGAIASGGMATVHFGRLVGPAGFARPVAIKRLHPQFARDPDFVQMFLDEARLAARIAHPNVVQTLDLVDTADEIFLVMEYVRGLSLASLVRTLRRRGERVPPRIASGIVVGVLEGLHAAHEAKDDRGARLDLVHRDVSPHNVLVGTDGVARLLDFGVAKAAGRLQTTRDGKVKGKVAYMAPEQVEGLPLTRRTDVFAASVLLWEVLTGRRLFYGDSDADSLRRVLNDRVPPPRTLVPDLPPQIDGVVLRGVERSADARYPTAHHMALELSACLPPAPPAEIGAWVEQTAADELNERASLIAAIERRPLDPPAGVSPIAGHATASHARAVTVQPAAPWRRLVIAILASVVATALVFIVVIVLRARPSHGPAPLERPAAASVGATAVTARADERSEAPPAPSAPPTSSAAEPPPRSAPSVARPAVTRAKPSGAATPESGTARPGCDPPYTEDAQGHVHFKPSCL